MSGLKRGSSGPSWFALLLLVCSLLLLGCRVEFNERPMEREAIRPAIPRRIVLQSDAPPADIDALQQVIVTDPNVVRAVYVSSPEAQRQHDAQRGGEQPAVERIGDEPLPAYLAVDFRGTASARDLHRFAQALEEKAVFARTVARPTNGGDWLRR